MGRHNFRQIKGDSKSPTDYIALLKFQNNLLDYKGVYPLTGVGTQAYTNDRFGNLLSAYNTINLNWGYNASLNVFQNTDKLTMCMWLKHSTLTADFRGGVGQWNTGGTVNTNLFSFQHGYQGLNPSFYIETTSGINILTATNQTSNNIWNHWACVYDGSIMELYINGILNNQVNWTGNFLNISRRFYVNNIYINGSENRINKYLNLDDIVLYNRALSDAEILKIYQNGF